MGFKDTFSPNEVRDLFPTSKIPNHDFIFAISEAELFTQAVLDMEADDDDELGPCTRFVHDIGTNDGTSTCHSVVLLHPEDRDLIGYYTMSSMVWQPSKFRPTTRLSVLEFSLDAIFVDDRYRGSGYSTALAASATQFAYVLANKYLKSVVDPDSVELTYSYDAISRGGEMAGSKIENALNELWDEDVFQPGAEMNSLNHN